MSLNKIGSSNFKNIAIDAIGSIEKFIKRDFFEIRYIKNSTKISHFFENTIDKNLERLKQALLLKNPTYGIIHKGKIIHPSSIDLYWIIEIVDDKVNFINGLIYWGIYLSLYSKTINELTHTIFYMPIIEETYHISREDGAFLNEKRLNLLNIEKQYIVSNSSEVSTDAQYQNRIYGSEILSIFFYASAKIDLLYLRNTEYNRLLSDLVTKEAKGKRTIDKNIIILE